MWEQRIKDMLIKVVLYQHGKYPAEKLDRELAEFLRNAENELCEAIRRNGGVCYKEALEEMTPKEAEDYIEDQIKNFEMLDKTGKIIADLLRLSLEFKDLDKMSLRDKILLFDKVIHAEHTAGAFKEYLAEEKSIFGVDITKIKEEADKEVEEILKGRKGAPDPPEEAEQYAEMAREYAHELDRKIEKAYDEYIKLERKLTQELRDLIRDMAPEEKGYFKELVGRSPDDWYLHIMKMVRSFRPSLPTKAVATIFAEIYGTYPNKAVLEEIEVHKKVPEEAFEFVKERLDEIAKRYLGGNIQKYLDAIEELKKNPGRNILEKLLVYIDERIKELLAECPPPEDFSNIVKRRDFENCIVNKLLTEDSPIVILDLHSLGLAKYIRQRAVEIAKELAKLPTERELWREAEELKKKYEEAEKHLRKPSIKEYYDWLKKTGRLGWVQEAIRRAKEVYPDVVTDLLMWELIYRALDREATKEDLVRYAEEWAKRVKEEAEKKKVVEEKPPTPPKPPEKPFFELAKKLAIEKLTLFTKAKALELGFNVEEANRIVQDLKDELTLLGTGIVTGDTTQEAAEREIEEGLRNLKQKKEEEKRKKTEEERKRVSREREDVLKRIRQEIERTLKREGYTRVTTALKEIAYDLEDLAESVVEGWLSFDEAVERGVRLARQYATPPKPPKAPPAVPRVERPPVEVPRRPEEFLSVEEAADIIWREYLGDLFNFGIRYVFENYLRERGMLEQDLGRVAYRLASKIRMLGQRMRREGEEKGIGRYIWASYALTRYAPEIVQFGLLWAMRKIVPEIWPELRLFRNVVEALRRTGIEGCTAKALVGVVYDYAGIPRAKWPEDIIQCYEAFVEAAERPPEVRRRPLWEYFE